MIINAFNIETRKFENFLHIVKIPQELDYDNHVFRLGRDYSGQVYLIGLSFKYHNDNALLLSPQEFGVIVRLAFEKIHLEPVQEFIESLKIHEYY